MVAEMFKYSNIPLQTCLLDIYNSMIASGSFEMSWQHTLFSMLPKSGDNSQPTNWRPIAVLKITGQVRSACMPRWQPCVRAQATLYKKKHYLPVMKATNSDSKRCQVSVDVSLQSLSCFQRKKARTFSSQARGGRPHRPLLGGVQSKQRRNHLCGRNVLMYAANFQYLIVTTASHLNLNCVGFTLV